MQRRVDDSGRRSLAAWLGRMQSRIEALRGWPRVGAAALCGVALTLAQPPLGLWPLLFVAWPVLLWMIAAAADGPAAFRLGWWTGAAFFVTGLYWVGHAFLVEGGKVWWYLPVMPVAVALLAGGLALFWGVGFWFAHRLGARGWRAAVALAAAMLVVEIARGTVLTGFPWAMQSHVWVGTPVMQAASLVGATALSGLTVLAAALPAGRSLGSAGFAAALVAGGWAFGSWRLGEPVAPPGPVIRLVQPDVGQFDKWAPENLVPIFNNLVELTGRPAATAPALTVWPEVAVTFQFDTSPEAIAIATAAKRGQGVLAVGSVRSEPARPRARYFNSLLFYDHTGARLGVYDKRTLTPFGEYVPYAWLLGRLGIGTLGDGLSGFTSGSEPGPFALPGLPPAAVLICYELIFPGLTRRTTASAEWIIQVTNDSWFGDSAGPRQHLAQARIRAIETGLPVARAANTGISAMIDPYGRILASLGLGQRGALDAPLPARLPSPLYARLGDGPISGMLLLVAAATLRIGRRREGIELQTK